LVTELSYDSSVDGAILTVKGQSLLNKILNFTFPAVFEPQVGFVSSATDIIQELLQAVNDDNPNYLITWDLGNALMTTPIQYYRNYRPVLEMIEELSKQNINGEFNALFYLDTNNHFIFKMKSKDTETTSLTEGVDYFKIKIAEKVWDVVNACILDCGKDPAGRNIHAMWYDQASAGEYGLKWNNTIEVRTEISTKLQSAQQALAGWTKNSDENKQNFPESSAYPLTLTFQGRTDDGVLTGSKVIVSSDTEYVQAIRKEAKWAGIAWIKSFISVTGYIKPKVDIEMSGVTWELGAGRTGLPSEKCLDNAGNPIAQGDFITVKCASYGSDFIAGLKLRVIQVNHELSSKGWVVTIRLETDVDDAATYQASGH
jgi:hypothetical protein